MLAAFCKEKRNLWGNTWCIGFTVRPICAILRSSTVGLATRLFVAVDKNQTWGKHDCIEI